MKTLWLKSGFFKSRIGVATGHRFESGFSSGLFWHYATPIYSVHISSFGKWTGPHLYAQNEKQPGSFALRIFIEYRKIIEDNSVHNMFTSVV